jgi:DNA-binding NarL/FixJ family response regulator
MAETTRRPDEAPSGPSSDGGWRVYICDDSDEYRLLLRTVLVEQGASVVGEASDGDECVRDAPGARPSIILLDWNMPVRTGAEALPLIRAEVPDAKVVVLSTSGLPETRERALTLGAHGFIKKPMDADDVPGLVRAALDGG